MVFLSIRPRSFSRTQQSSYTLDHSPQGQVVLTRKDNEVYLRLKLDLFWAHARGVKRFGVLSDSVFTNCPSKVDFYVPINPWHYAIPTLRDMSDSMHTEEDIRLTLEDRYPALAGVLMGIPLQQCPGLISRMFDGELAYQFKEDTYLQHCKERVIALSATTALSTLDRAINFCAQLFDQTTIQKLRQDLGVSKVSQSPIAVTKTKNVRQGVRQVRVKCKAKATSGTGPIDAFLRTIKK
ncbi:Hypothetical protein GLP15_3216 [Giardia lamblia P15]|uniref:Uncharacterized protein n=1 Tax=Giardia intestinalis (strain P15) TaxID=658858 RepID=E1EWT4_GIAIA|nr:Hypothetical protein GLP15_3216 [Giardia lamblia P15]